MSNTLEEPRKKEDVHKKRESCNDEGKNKRQEQVKEKEWKGEGKEENEGWKEEN